VSTVEDEEAGSGDQTKLKLETD